MLPLMMCAFVVTVVALVRNGILQYGINQDRTLVVPVSQQTINRLNLTRIGSALISSTGTVHAVDCIDQQQFPFSRADLASVVAAVALENSFSSVPADISSTTVLHLAVSLKATP